MINLGERIKKVRSLKRISQVELESKTGIKREYLSKIENQELKNPTYKTLLKICSGLGISLSELVEKKGGPQLRKEPPLNIVTDLKTVTKVTKAVKEVKYVTVPLISQKTANKGPGYIDVEEIEQYWVMPVDYVVPNDNTSRFRCVRLAEGDYSMSPIMKPGAIVGIDSLKKGLSELEGELILLNLDNDKCGVRRLKLYKNHLVALPQNIADYNPIVLTLGGKRQILGRVVWCLNKFGHDT